MILVVDDMAIFREPIAACLRLAGWETDCAADGKDGLSKARLHKPDLILLDMAMPGIDGLAFLRALRGDPNLKDVPVIALTAVTDKDYILQAKELGICEYLLKSRFRTPELLDRVQRHAKGKRQSHAPAATAPARTAPADDARGAAAPVPPPIRRQPDSESSPAPAASSPPGALAPAGATGAAAPITRLLDRDECIRRTQQALEGKTLAGVVAQVMSLTASPRGDMAQLAELIGRDPMLSAGVLTAANSAAYASSRGVVTTIAEAVRHIGCSGIRNIAAGLGIIEAMPRTSPDGFNPIRCWQHSFAVAQLCETLAEAKGQQDAALAYVVGLCHDLAEILFRTQFAAEFQQVRSAQATTGRPREELERAILGMSQRQLLLTITQSIGLPDAIQAPIEAYYEGRRRGPAISDVLRLAEYYANGLLLASGQDSLVTAFTRPECRTVTGTEEPPIPDGQQFRSQVLGLAGALARLSREEEQRVMAPIYPRKTVRLYIARDPALSPFSPVEAALASMADVQPAGNLPSDQEIAYFDGIVVVSRKPMAAGFTAQDIARCTKSRPLPVLWLCLTDEDAGPGSSKPVVLPAGIDSLFHFVEQVDQQRSRTLNPAA